MWLDGLQRKLSQRAQSQTNRRLVGRAWFNAPRVTGIVLYPSARLGPVHLLPFVKLNGRAAPVFQKRATYEGTKLFGCVHLLRRSRR